jgi:peptidyl-prolyl cis-trans isomerase SurA
MVFFLRYGRGVAVAFLLAALGIPAFGAESRTVQLDGMAAYVDDEAITIGDVRQTLEPLVAKLRQVYHGSDLEEQLRKAYPKALDDLIERRLILKAFAKTGQTIPDRVIERRINEMVFERFDNDRAVLMDALRREQLSYDEWRNQVREHIIITSMRKMILDQKVVISPAAIREVYDSHPDLYRIPGQIHLSLIRIAAGANDMEKPVRRELAESTRRRAMEGSDFSSLAKQVSEDGKAEQGGDWGWMTPDELRPELAVAIRDLPVGTLSPLVEVGSDFYLLKVLERREATVVPFSEAQVDIERDLRRQESVRQYDAWILRQKREFNVRIVEAEVK